jgi:hypothetical protein
MTDADVVNPYGGLDVLFTFTPITGGYIWLKTDIMAISAFSDPDDVDRRPLYIKIGYKVIDGVQYIVVSTILDTILVHQSDFPIGDDSDIPYNIRIFIYDEYVSVYCNDIGVYWYVLGEVEYPTDTISATLSTTGETIALSNICRSELYDQREAVYVDYEANTENAIQSVIQQRPIEINPGIDRTLEFTYISEKEEINAQFIKNYKVALDDNLQISSDGIVYWADVGVSISEETAEQVGFITRMYRLSELSSGALQAAAIYQKRALEKRNMVTITGRLDPRIQPRDIYVIDVVLTGTGRQIQEIIIIEGVTIQTENGKYKMTVTGRRKIYEEPNC